MKAVPGGEQHNYVASKLPRSSLFGQILRQHCMYPLWDIYIYIYIYIIRLNCYIVDNVINIINISLDAVLELST